MNNVEDAYGMFEGCSALTDISGEITNIKVNLNLSTVNLSRSSALVFINGLSEEGGLEPQKVITFSQSTYNTLDESDIALASNKGWAVTIETS